MGHMTPQLSPQNLISCDTRNQGGCAGGRIDGAWWYLRRRGYTKPPFTPTEKELLLFWNTTSFLLYAVWQSGD